MDQTIHPAAQPFTTWLVRFAGFLLSTTLVIGMMAARARAGGV